MNELVQRAQQGDDRAFIQLFERHKLELWKTATAVLNNPDDAADALQDTVLKAWRAIPGFEGRSAVGTWLMRILLRACYDIQRKRLREIPHVMDGSGSGAADFPATNVVGLQAGAARSAEGRGVDASHDPDCDLVLDVRGAMGCLSADDRLVLALFYLEDCPVKQIAHVLDLSEGAVRTRLSRARDRFKAIYREAKNKEAGVV